MLRRRVALLALVAALVALTSHGVRAHAGPRVTDPFDGATLGASPTHIRLAFTETPEPSLSSIRVLDTSGAAHHIGTPEAVPANPLALTVRVRTLPKGVYIVNWRVVSAVDGHATEGAYAFGVLVAPTGNVGAASATNTEASPLEMVARWLFIAGLVVLLGAAAAGVARFGGASDGVLGAAGWLLAAAGLALLVIAQSRNAGASVGTLMSSAIGRALIWRGVAIAAAGAALLAGWLRPSSQRTSGVGAMLATMAAIAVHVAAGHAGAANRWLWFPTVVAQWAHFAAAGIWLGGLAALLAGVRGAPSADKANAVRRFSRVALVALLVVAATGAARAFGELVSWRDLIATWYGRAISTKVALLVIIAALGAINRWRSVPSALSTLRPLRRVGRGELAVAAGALAASAVLGTLPPPAAGLDVVRGLVIAGTDFGTTVRVQLATTSDQPGPNRFVVRAVDYDSSTPIREAIVSLRFIPLDDPGVPPTSLPLTPGPDDTYVGSGANFAFDGRWRVTALIQRGADSREVSLEAEVRATRHFLSVQRTPGEAPMYTIDVGRAGLIRFSPDPEHAGPSTVTISVFSLLQMEQPIESLVATATAEGHPTRHLTVRRLTRSQFAADIDLHPGVNRLTAIARTPDGTRVRAALDLTVQ